MQTARQVRRQTTKSATSHQSSVMPFAAAMRAAERPINTNAMGRRHVPAPRHHAQPRAHFALSGLLRAFRSWMRRNKLNMTRKNNRANVNDSEHPDIPLTSRMTSSCPHSFSVKGAPVVMKHPDYMPQTWMIDRGNACQSNQQYDIHTDARQNAWKQSCVFTNMENVLQIFSHTGSSQWAHGDSEE